MRPTLLALALAATTVVGQEPNTPGGSLVVNEFDPGFYPISQVILGPTVRLRVSGGAQLPYTLVAAPLNAGNNLTAMGQRVDVGTPPGYADLTIVLDGTNPTGSFFNLLSVLNGAGQSQWVFPAGQPGATVTYALQGIVWGPGHPDGFDLTAATELTLAACAGSIIPLGDDAFAQLTLSGWSFPFYGVNYNSVFVGSNGFVTFGVGDTDFTASPAEMLAGPPRIADLWIDLSPNVGGANTWFDDGVGSATLCRQDVLLYNTTLPNTLSLTIDRFGSIQIFYPGGQQTALTPLVGVSPGGSASVTLPVNLSASHLTSGAPLAARYEFFDQNHRFDLTASNLVFLPETPGNAYQIAVY